VLLQISVQPHRGQVGFHYLEKGTAGPCVTAGHPALPFPDLLPFGVMHAGAPTLVGCPAAGAATSAPAAAAQGLAAVAAPAVRPSVTENTLNKTRNQAVTVKSLFSNK